MQRILTLAEAASWRAPVALWQGLQARRTVLRLPQADGETGFIDGDGPESRVLVIGDSLAGGVGVGHHSETLAGGVARRLAERTGGPVHWQVRAQTGFTAREVISLVDPAEVSAADVVVLSVGANDAKNMHRPQQWRADLGELLATVTAGAADATPVVLLPVPILSMCPALPGVLGGVLGRRAEQFDAIATEVAADYPLIRRFERFVPPGGVDLFAEDGFHPSAAFHAVYTEQIAEVLGQQVQH